MLKTLVRQSLATFGYEVRRIQAETLPKRSSLPPDISEEQLAIYYSVCLHSRTSPERIMALLDAVDYIHRTRVPGAIVECGVWRGGSMMAAAKRLLQSGDTDRELFLFDTFEGMSGPTNVDVDLFGNSARDLLRKSERNEQSAWACCDLDTVTRNMCSTGYPEGNVRFVKGKVEDTVPGHAPDSISLLRLDTDWYESTKHELVHLYPRLSPGGVLIIDDYGHWAGARKATDEYLQDNGISILLNRIDYSAKIGIKTGASVRVQTGT